MGNPKPKSTRIYKAIRTRQPTYGAAIAFLRDVSVPTYHAVMAGMIGKLFGCDVQDVLDDARLPPRPTPVRRREKHPDTVVLAREETQHKGWTYLVFPENPSGSAGPDYMLGWSTRGGFTTLHENQVKRMRVARRWVAQPLLRKFKRENRTWRLRYHKRYLNEARAVRAQKEAKKHGS